MITDSNWERWLFYEFLSQQDRIIRQQEKIMADLTKLQSVAAQLTTDVQTLMASSTKQSDVDAITAALTTLDGLVQAVINPAPPAPPAAAVSGANQ